MSPIAERLQTLRTAGLSLSQIADILSREVGRYISRNAAAGLVHRAKLPPLEKKPRNPRKPRKRKPSRLQLQAGFGFKSGADNVRMKRTRPERLPDYRLEDVPAASILELTSKTCRFVCGEPRKPLEEIYCGARVVAGTKWCVCHFRRVYVPGGGR